MKKPAAPAVYRPQIPKVLQTKQSKNTTPAETRKLPSAPPAYRPQPPAHCLQKKSAPRNSAVQPKGTIQRFGWAVHDGRDMKRSKIVDENLRKASQRYTHTQTTKDPEKEYTPERPFLNPGEAIHLHAHGHEEAFSGFGAGSLAWELTRKFDLEDLPGRVIVLHSCKTGQADYGKELLQRLVAFAFDEQVALTGTTVYAPVNSLVVEDDGLSYVAKAGVDDAQLRVSERSAHLQKLGEGWRGWRVTVNGSVEEIPNPGRFVGEVLNTREAPKERKFKPPKLNQRPQRQYGYYDDPRQPLKREEKALIARAMGTNPGRYPPEPE